MQNILKNDIIVLFMTHYMCYNKGTENEITVTKEKSKCAEISEKENIEMMRTERKAERTTEDCGFSGYSMFALAGGLLLCIGIIVYAFFAG